MGLGQGGRGDRGLEAGVEGVERPAQAARDLGLGDLQREGGQAVLQVRQVLGELASEDVGPGRQELAHLDGRRALALQHPRQALARPALARRSAGQQAQGAARQPRRRRQDRLDLARHKGVGPDQGPAGGDQAQAGGDPAHAARVSIGERRGRGGKKLMSRPESPLRALRSRPLSPPAAAKSREKRRRPRRPVKTSAPGADSGESMPGGR
jgi:hypothetical protein